MANIQKITSAEKNAIKSRSVLSLPDRPSDAGYKASDIKKAIIMPVVGEDNSIAKVIDRIVDGINENMAQKAATSTSGHVASIDANGNLADSGIVASDVATKMQNIISSITAVMDSDYKLTISLKNANGGVVSSDVVDLPLEELVVSGTYDDGYIIFTLRSGDTIEIAVSDLVAGLMKTLTSYTKGHLASIDEDGNVEDSGIDKDNVALQNGLYALFTAGLAMNLQGRPNDAVGADFFFRTSGGTADIGNGNAKIKSIHGNTLIFNQFCTNGNFASADGWNFVNSSGSASGNAATVTPTSTSINVNRSIAYTANHKMLYVLYVRSSKATDAALGDNVSVFGSVDLTANTWTRMAAVNTSASGSNQIRIYFGRTSTNLAGTDEIRIKNVQLFDLTRMFGAGNEPTAAEFSALFPLDYYAYDAGSLLNFNGTGIRTVGFNAFHEEWQADTAINASTGATGQSAGYATTDWIPVMAGQKYYIRVDATDTALSACVLARYDADKHFVSSAQHYVTSNWANRVITIPNGVAFIRFYIRSSYTQNVCVNLSWSGWRNGEYEPYRESTLALPVAAYFPTGMKSVGAVFDELTKTKAVQRIGASLRRGRRERRDRGDGRNDHLLRSRYAL